MSGLVLTQHEVKALADFAYGQSGVRTFELARDTKRVLHVLNPDGTRFQLSPQRAETGGVSGQPEEPKRLLVYRVVIPERIVRGRTETQAEADRLIAEDTYHLGRLRSSVRKNHGGSVAYVGSEAVE